MITSVWEQNATSYIPHAVRMVTGCVAGLRSLNPMRASNHSLKRWHQKGVFPGRLRLVLGRLTPGPSVP